MDYGCTIDALWTYYGCTMVIWSIFHHVKSRDLFQLVFPGISRHLCRGHYINYPFWANQTMQIYGNLVVHCLGWLYNIMPPVLGWHFTDLKPKKVAGTQHVGIPVKTAKLDRQSREPQSALNDSRADYFGDFADTYDTKVLTIYGYFQK